MTVALFWKMVLHPARCSSMRMRSILTRRGAVHESKCPSWRGRRLSVRAVKAAVCAFIGAQRRALLDLLALFVAREARPA
jgi:hypothetical protein